MEYLHNAALAGSDTVPNPLVAPRLSASTNFTSIGLPNDPISETVLQQIRYRTRALCIILQEPIGRRSKEPVSRTYRGRRDQALRAPFKTGERHGRPGT